MQKEEESGTSPSTIIVQLDRILSSPFPRSIFVSRAVGLVDMGDFGDERIIGVRVGKHGTDGEED